MRKCLLCIFEGIITREQESATRRQSEEKRRQDYMQLASLMRLSSNTLIPPRGVWRLFPVGPARMDWLIAFNQDAWVNNSPLRRLLKRRGDALFNVFGLAANIHPREKTKCLIPVRCCADEVFHKLLIPSEEIRTFVPYCCSANAS